MEARQVCCLSYMSCVISVVLVHFWYIRFHAKANFCVLQLFIVNTQYFYYLYCTTQNEWTQTLVWPTNRISVEKKLRDRIYARLAAQQIFCWVQITGLKIRGPQLEKLRSYGFSLNNNFAQHRHYWNVDDDKKNIGTRTRFRKFKWTH